MTPRREWIGFTLYMTALAVAYGITHDLVTAHVAVEYFTVWHPKVVNSQSPIMMALVWGVLATWWVGLGGGLILVLANELGSWPAVPYASLRKWTLRLMVVLWLSAMVVLMGIYALANLVPEAKRKPIFEHDRRLMAVAVTHGWSYSAATVAIAGLGVFVLFRRRQLSRVASAEKT